MTFEEMFRYAIYSLPLLVMIEIIIIVWNIKISYNERMEEKLEELRKAKKKQEFRKKYQ